MGSHGCRLHRDQLFISQAESQKLNILLLLGRKANNGLFIWNHNGNLGRGRAQFPGWKMTWASALTTLLLWDSPQEIFQSMLANCLFTNSNAKPRDSVAPFDAKQRNNSNSGVKGRTRAAQPITRASCCSEVAENLPAKETNTHA